MSLYVGLFRGDAEVTGWVLGHYSDYAYFRQVVMQSFPAGSLPLLLGSSDCDAVFPSSALAALKAELVTVATRLRTLPPVAPSSAFEHNRELWQQAKSLSECFHNVDGEPLIEALIGLCEQGIAENLSLALQ